MGSAARLEQRYTVYAHGHHQDLTPRQDCRCLMTRQDISLASNCISRFGYLGSTFKIAFPGAVVWLRLV